MPEEKKHRKLPSIELTPSVSIIIAGVIIAGAIIFTNQHPAPSAATTAAAEQGTTASANVPAPSASDHIIGSPSAPIVLVEYSDFQCPYCQMIYPSIKQIVSQSNGQVAWVMREFPLYQIHPQAMPAANAARIQTCGAVNDLMPRLPSNCQTGIRLKRFSHAATLAMAANKVFPVNA